MLRAVSKRDAGFKCKAMVKTILLLDDHACWQVKYAISSHAVELSLLYIYIYIYGDFEFMCQ